MTLEDSMKIAVIGANGRTGRIVVKDALARGHEVVAAITYGDLATALLDSLTRRDLCRHAAYVAN